MSNRPKVFISSTIYDFKDLRSSLRFYLSSLGFEPVLSEFNDFRAPVDENSYDACASAISSCQYFILLIGTRIGGFYDSEENISITRQEYRQAYEHLKKGNLKILAFVRASIWDAKEDRQSLKKLLVKEYQSEKELSDADVKKIVEHSSRFVNDAEITFSFIDEVARKDEMKAAVISGETRPPGNWIYSFTDFSDIIDALQIQLNISSTLTELSALSNLKRELLSNLSLLLDKYKGEVQEGQIWVSFLKNHNLDNYEAETEIPSGKLAWVLIYLLSGFSKSQQLAVQYSHEIIRSGQLLKLDHQENKVYNTLMGGKVLDMIDEVNKLRRIDKALSSQRIPLMKKYRPMAVSMSEELVSIPNEFLYSIRYAHDRHKNIISLSKAIVRAIDGDDSLLKNIKLQPNVPSQKMADEIDRSTPSIPEIEMWINQ